MTVCKLCNIIECVLHSVTMCISHRVVDCLMHCLLHSVTGCLQQSHSVLAALCDGVPVAHHQECQQHIITTCLLPGVAVCLKLSVHRGGGGLRQGTTSWGEFRLSHW